MSTRLSLTLALLMLGLLAIGSVERADAERRPCTITGTKRADNLRSGPRADVICARGGNDEVQAGDGNDEVRGAGGGKDRLEPGKGANVCIDPERALAPPNLCWYALVVDEVVLNPTTVDTSEADRAIAASVHARSMNGEQITSLGARVDVPLAPGMGVSAGAGDFQLVSGNGQSGTWFGNLVLPRHTAPGKHWVDIMVSTGAPVAPWHEFGPQFHGADLERAGLAGSVTQAGLGDAGRPVVQSISIDPDTVNTANAGADVHVAARITDDLTGVTYANVRFDSPGGFESDESISLSLATGTALDGVWTGTVHLPRGARHGTYRAEVWTADAFGEVHRTSGDLYLAGLEHQFRQVGAEDAVAPELTSLTIPPTVTASEPFDVSAGARDAYSGLDRIVLGATNSSGGYGMHPSELVSGTDNDGVWSGIDYLTTPGTYALDAYLVDKAGNVRRYATADLAALGLPTQITVTG